MFINDLVHTVQIKYVPYFDEWANFKYFVHSRLKYNEFTVNVLQFALMDLPYGGGILKAKVRIIRIERLSGR